MSDIGTIPAFSLSITPIFSGALLNMKAIWHDQVVAESEDTLLFERNHYFPAESIAPFFFTKSDTTSVCPWKGVAHYYSLVVNGEKNADAAWCYPEPLPDAQKIANHIAFWRGVTILG